jgi:hypothetical protein
MKKKLLITFFTVCYSLHSQTSFQQNIVIDKSFGAIIPNNVTSVDIDNDGYPDVLSSSLEKVAWFKNLDGLGNFGKAIPIEVGLYEYKFAYASDFDNDKDSDVIFSYRNNNSQIFLSKNDGKGNFQVATSLVSTTLYITSVQVIDIDGDNDNDIIYGTDNSISLLENTDGFGNFTNRVITKSNYTSFFAIDVDKDSRADLIIDSGYNLDCYKIDSTTGLTKIDAMDTFAQGSFITGADIDNDGDIDIATVFENGSDRKIQWYNNTNGLGNFANKQTLVTLPSIPIGSSNDISTVSFVDLDNDKKNDILLTDSNPSKVSWFKNTGSNVFGTNKTITLNAENIRGSFVIDLDGDLNLDVISFSRDDHKLEWYKNTDGKGIFEPQKTISTTTHQLNHFDKGDIDGDGDLDLVSSSHADKKVAWYENTNGKGDFSKQQKLITNKLVGARDVYIANLDNDTDNDLVSFSFYQDNGDFSKIVWYENIDGKGNFAKENVIVSNKEYIQRIFPIDIDSDNDIDIVCASFNNIISLYRNNGNKTFALQEKFSITDNSNQSTSTLYSEDMDNDNDKDVIVNFSNSEIVWYENSNGLGTFTTKHIINNSLKIDKIHIVDLDGDNDKDIAFCNNSQSKIGWFKNTDGKGNFDSPITIATALNLYHPNCIYAEDLDRDGDKDLTTNSETGNKFIWYKNDGLGNFGSSNEISGSVGRLTRINSGDIDGDGIVDLITSSYEDDKLAWYKNSITLSLNEFSDTKFDLTLYPIPAVDFLHIKSEETISEIKVYNELSQIILTNSNSNSIEISKLNDGIYFLEIKSNTGKKISRKVIKE